MTSAETAQQQPEPKRLRDVVPQEFFREFMETPAARHLDRTVISTRDNQRGPFRQRYIYVWWELEGGYAVGWNENPARGWSFPVARYTKGQS